MPRSPVGACASKRAGAWVLAPCLLVLHVAASVEATTGFKGFVRTATLQQPAGWRELAAVQFFDQTWICVSGEVLWTLDPARQLVHRSSSTGVPADDGRPSTWALPALAARSGRLAVDLVADHRGGAWLVDRHAQRFWRLDSFSGFSRATQVGEAVGPAAGGLDGTLALNTPQHSASVFAIYGPDGVVRRRFGVRRRATAGLGHAYANTWRIAALPGGDWLAAHAFAEDIVRFDGEGRVLWEAKASAVGLRSLRRATAPGTVVHYATGLIPGTASFHVRYGTLPAFEEFSLSGAWIRTIPRVSVDAPSIEGPWITAGASTAGEGVLITAEPPHVVRYVLTDLPLEPPTTLRVETDVSAPVRKARLLVHSAGRAGLEALTDDEGAATVEGIARDVPVRVDVSAPGFLSTTAAGRLAELAAEPIRLERPPHLCLSVVDRASGALLPGFTATVAREHVSGRTGRLDVGPAQAFESVDGPRCLAPPHHAPWHVTVAAAGHAPYRGRLAEPGLHRIELEAGAALLVTVTDRGGQPVEGATVFVEASRFVRGGASLAMEGETSRTTDSNGHAEWTELAADEYTIRVLHPMFLPARETVELAGRTEADISMPAGGRIAVVVRDASEQPVGDAIVQLLPGPHLLASEVACTTSSAGECRLAPAPVGTVEILASAAHHLPARQRVVVPAEGDARGALVLKRGTRITGTVDGVRDYAPTPLEVAVGVHGYVLVSPIAESGDFAFEEVAVGRSSLWVRESGTSSALLFEEITIEPGGAHLSIRLPVPIRLFGTIRSGGRPCPACAMRISREGAEVGAATIVPVVQLDGSYEARLPGRGTYRIAVSQAGAAGSVVETLRLDANRRRDISIGAATLTGRVVARDRQRIPASASVALYDGNGAHVAEGVADEAGRFRLSGLSEGRYRVVATSGSLSGEAHVAVSGGNTRDLEVIVDERSVLEVRLLDSLSGSAVPNADVTVASSGGVTHLAGLRPDATGLVSIPILGGGPADLVIKARGFAYKTVHGVSAAGSPRDILLVPGGRSFSIDIETASEPCAFELRSGGLAVGLTMDRAPGPVPLSVRRALFNELEPGAYVAAVTTCDGRRHEQAVSLSPGTVPALRFSFR